MDQGGNVPALTIGTVAFFHNFLLFRSSSLHAQHGQPGAFIVLDVSADLAGYLWITETIQEIVLNL